MSKPGCYKGPLKGKKYNKNEIIFLYPSTTLSHEIHAQMKWYPAYKKERRLLANLYSFKTLRV
jgi:hypothetical protein